MAHGLDVRLRRCNLHLGRDGARQRRQGTLIDNDALRVFNIQLPDGASGPVTLEHRNAALIGMEDGTGFAVAANGGTPRFLPMARGRVDWLGDGQLEVHAGQRASVTR